MYMLTSREEMTREVQILFDSRSIIHEVNDESSLYELIRRVDQMYVGIGPPIKVIGVRKLVVEASLTHGTWKVVEFSSVRIARKLRTHLLSEKLLEE